MKTPRTVLALLCAGAMLMPALAFAQVGKGLVDPNIAGEKELMGVPHFNDVSLRAGFDGGAVERGLWQDVRPPESQYGAG
jgi:hypothetical protein